MKKYNKKPRCKGRSLIAGTKKSKKCTMAVIDDTDYCDNHADMIDYTDDMIAKISYCSSNNHFRYCPPGYDTCDRCRGIGKENRKRWYGGTKMLETPLYVGAFNHLDLEGLIEHMKEVKWEEPENVQLIVKLQEADKFEIIGSIVVLIGIAVMFYFPREL